MLHYIEIKTDKTGYYFKDSLDCDIYTTTYYYNRRHGERLYGIWLTPDSVAIVNFNHNTSFQSNDIGKGAYFSNIEKWQEKYREINP